MSDTPAARPFQSFGQAFLAEAAAGRLVYARCAVCNRTLGYTRRLCECGSADMAWHAASGEARIVSHVIYRRTYSENFPAPYTVVRVALAEGPRLSALWHESAHKPVTGMAVQLHLDSQARLLAAPI